VAQRRRDAEMVEHELQAVVDEELGRVQRR
jgi:hypothetical protein